MRALSRALYLLALLSLPASVALAQPRQEQPPCTLRVDGTGEARAVPDEAFIDLAVETFAPTAREAAEQNAQRLQRVLAALERAGVPRKQLQTQSFTVSPERVAPAPDRPLELRGYRVSNVVTVHVPELGRVGELLDVALQAGANRVDSVRFGLRQPERVEAEALRNAVARARQSARVLAESLGLALGPIVEVSTVAEPPRLFAMAPFEGAGGMGGPTPIQPQEQLVQARVVLVYSLVPAPRERP